MSQRSTDDFPPALLQQIRTKLRPVCPDIPDDEFVRLVEDVARVKLKYAAIQDFEDAGKTG
jgi:hypothetical protein